MTTAIKRRRGTTAQHSTFTGLEGEITVDTTKDTLVVHDGATAGGFALLREDLSNNTNVSTLSNTQTLSNKTINLSSNTLTGTTAQFNTALSDGDFATLAGTETLSNKTFSTNPTISSGTANGVAYLNGSKVLTTGSALTFDGAKLYVQGSAAGTAATFTDATNSTLNITHSAGGLVYFRDGGSNRQIGLNDQYLQFFTSNSEQMRLTSTGLGIGTSSPSYKLDVAGEVRANNLFRTTDGTNIGLFGSGVFASGVVGIGSSNSIPLVFGTGATERMRLDTSGNLGLGVTPSAWSTGGVVALAAQVGNYAVVSSSGAYGGAYSSNAYYSSTGWKYITSDNATQYNQVSGKHTWHTAPSGTAGNAISFTQAMTLDASGNLGIGTSSPTQRLHIQAATNSRAIAIQTDATTNLGHLDWLYNSNSSYTRIIGDGRNTGYIALQTNDTERMRIDSSGNLLVGQTSSDARIAVTYPGGGSLNGLRLNTANSGTSTAIQFVYNAANQVGTITTTTTATSYNTSSDYRLKENIQPMQNALGVVQQLNPVTYSWKADGSDGQGFIAHELQAVVPDCVTGEKDAVDADGKPVYQGIDTSFLVATLCKAIQEQQEQINQLTARVAQLEGK